MVPAQSSPMEGKNPPGERETTPPAEHQILHTLEVELREGSGPLKHIEHEPIDKRDFFEPIEAP